MNKFTHIDSNEQITMVDVGEKPTEKRYAKATGKISLASETISAITSLHITKGNVLATAKIAGIQAAKKTSELIPLCHQLILTKIDVHLTIISNGIIAEGEVFCTGQTGAEMEALTAVSVALLTIYDMCKAIDKKMKIEWINLVEKKKY